MRWASAILVVVAVVADGCPSPGTCSKNNECTDGQLCVGEPGSAVGHCQSPPANTTGEGEGDAAEGEGDVAEGEGDAGEGEGDAGEGEGDAGEGEGDAGEGEGEGPLELGPGVFVSGAATTASATFLLSGGFVTPAHILVSESASFRLESFR